MRKDYRDYLNDIFTAMEEIAEFAEGMDFEKFLADKRTINAVIRSLEVIGEAAKKIPEEIRQKYRDIPWKRMAGMRDKLIHEYSGVDLEIIWTVVQEELPPLKPIIEKILKEIEKNS